MRREEEMLSARRNKVISNSVVGNTLNSTGRMMYMETISTITDIMMSVTKKKSSRKLGMGAMSARMMASTAMGTAISLHEKRGMTAEPGAIATITALASAIYATPRRRPCMSR